VSNMTWEDILKLSPKDRQKFNLLGEEYAPRDMRQARLLAALPEVEKGLRKIENDFKIGVRRQLIYEDIVKVFNMLKEAGLQPNYGGYPTDVGGMLSTIRRMVKLYNYEERNK